LNFEQGDLIQVVYIYFIEQDGCLIQVLYFYTGSSSPTRSQAHKSLEEDGFFYKEKKPQLISFELFFYFLGGPNL